MLQSYFFLFWPVWDIDRERAAVGTVLLLLRRKFLTETSFGSNVELDSTTVFLFWKKSIGNLSLMLPLACHVFNRI